MAKKKRRILNKNRIKRPRPSYKPAEDLESYIGTQKEKLKRDRKMLTVLRRFIRALEAEFPKSRKPRIHLTANGETVRHGQGLQPPRFWLWVNMRPKKNESVLSCDPILKRVAEKTGLFEYFMMSGSGSDFKSRDSDFIEVPFQLKA